MAEPCRLLILQLDGQRYGLALLAVERVVRVPSITPLPGAPAGVMGMIQLQAQVLPIFDLRSRFGLSARALRLSDRIVIAQANGRLVGVYVDKADEVAEYRSEDVIEATQVIDESVYIRGVIRLADGLLLIHDLDTFLSLAELAQLNAVLDTTT